MNASARLLLVVVTAPAGAPGYPVTLGPMLLAAPTVPAALRMLWNGKSRSLIWYPIQASHVGGTRITSPSASDTS